MDSTVTYVRRKKDLNRVISSRQQIADEGSLTVRAMEAEDLPAALELQAQNYPPFLIEDNQAFASRLNVAAPYCLVALLDGTLVGYLLAHGWPRRSPPPVGKVLSNAELSEVLFIHDLSIGSIGRGLGIGLKLVERAFELAARDGLRSAELIAVEGAATYWERFGFANVAIGQGLADKVAGYGAEARWMEREFE